MNIVNKILENFKTNKELYIGEKVTISEHMIQTAMLAEKDNSSKSLDVSCEDLNIEGICPNTEFLVFEKAVLKF